MGDSWVTVEMTVVALHQKIGSHYQLWFFTMFMGDDRYNLSQCTGEQKSDFKTFEKQLINPIVTKLNCFQTSYSNASRTKPSGSSSGTFRPWSCTMSWDRRAALWFGYVLAKAKPLLVFLFKLLCQNLGHEQWASYSARPYGYHKLVSIRTWAPLLNFRNRYRYFR